MSQTVLRSLEQDSYTTEDNTVLIVDDDSLMIDTIGAYLSEEIQDVSLVTENSVTAACDRLEAPEMSFTCIVSDYQMPKMNGLEFLKSVREHHPRLPFVLYTGKGSEEIASRAIDAGVTGYLQKGGPDQLRRLAHRVEQAIARYETQRAVDNYATVLHELNYPIYLTGPDGQFEFVNESFADLTGYPRDALVGNDPSLIKDEAAVKTVKDNLRTILSAEGPDSVAFEIQLTTSDGASLPCRDHIAALKYDGEFRGTVGFLQDLSEVRACQRRAERHRERLEEVLTVLSHDLRSPIQKAQGATELIKERGDPEDFQRLDAAHAHLEQLVDEVLTLARQGEPVEHTELVDLRTLVGACWDRVRTEDASLSVSKTLCVVADKRRLRSLIENLLSNAVRHSKDTVAVRIGRTGADGFYVEDDGPGIPPDDREQVFDPGYTTAPVGTGFGLPIVKQVAEAHGWEVTVTESDDGGARFEFSGVEIAE